MPLDENIDFEFNQVMFLHSMRSKTMIIYVVTVLFVMVTLISLPLIHTTVSVNGQGSLQSNIEKVELITPVSGRISRINLSDNKSVIKGELLLEVDPVIPRKQQDNIRNRVLELKYLLSDALYTLRWAGTSSAGRPVLRTGLYQASWQQFLAQVQHAANLRDQALKTYKRYETLYEKKVVSEAEFEQNRFNYHQALSDFTLVIKKFKTEWQIEVNQYKKELKELESQGVQLKEQEKSYHLNAAISGTIQNLSGLQPGTFVYNNQKIGEISPDSALMAICYIKPSSIGLIKIGQDVHFQIDAFNYNQWGLLKGLVQDISDDVIILNQQPFFKVKCRLSQDHLVLKNGYKGLMKKGMTFHAHFNVTERNLAQLLYDQVDDWLNPQKTKT